METLAALVGTRSLLLILDNCEHLAAACGTLAERLLRACPRLTILATSRETLGVAGETTWRVPSLSLPDPRNPPRPERLHDSEAVRLFAERARSARPSFEVTERNAPAVVQVCSELDGIPLAIELAAARVRGLSVEQIAQRLGDRFRLLVAGNRAAEPRHRTLRSVVDWSYELLPAPEQVFLRRLSVFAGGWTLEAAEGVCAGGEIEAESVLPLLFQLLDKSLLLADEQSGTIRYRLLETLRQYGGDRLRESGEEEILRGRHRDWYVRFTDRGEEIWFGPGQVAWLDQLEIELDNVRAALDWCAVEIESSDAGAASLAAAEAALRMCSALFRFWSMRAYVSEGRARVERTLELAGSSVRTPARSKVLMCLAFLLVLQGEAESGRPLVEEGLSLARELGDPLGMVLNLVGLGVLRQQAGALDDAVACFEEAVVIGQEVGNPVGYYLPRYWLAGALQVLGDYDRADDLLEEHLALARARADPWNASMTLFGLGQLALAQGMYERAERRFRECLAGWRGTTDAYGVATGLGGVAWAAAARGHADRAARLFGAEDALRERIGCLVFPLWQADHERWLAAARAGIGDAAFDAAWSEGRAMSLDQAIGYALEADRPTVPSTAAVAPDARRQSPPLTRREYEVAALIARGLTNWQIARELGIAVRTVHAHVGNILGKLGFSSRAQVAAWTVGHSLSGAPAGRRSSPEE